MAAEEAALLRAIAAAPDEDTPRLVYAAWLEEHGQPDRARFIRLQVEQATLDEYDPRVDELYEQGKQLLAKQGNEKRWTPRLPRAMRYSWFQRGFVENVSC